MWDLLFVISFIINVGLLVYFLKPELPGALKRTKKKEEVKGYYDDTDMNRPVLIKEADSFDYTSVFDDKGWRNLIGFKSKGDSASDEV
jgi:hypothetical protein